MPDLRPVEEIEYWKTKCPVARFESVLLENGIASRPELDDINAEIMIRIDGAVNYALESPLPAPEDALENVYSE